MSDEAKVGARALVTATLRAMLPDAWGTRCEAGQIYKQARASATRWWHMTADQKNGWVEARLAQAKRERWRQMLLLLKAKLEIVRIGLSTVEKEFMADMVLPSGRTAFVALAEALAKGLEPGDTPRQLGSGT